MKHVLLAYYSHAGHTARIARRIAETIEAEGSRCDVVSMREAVREGVDWDKYDIVIVGSPIVYGVYTAWSGSLSPPTATGLSRCPTVSLM